MQSLRECLIVRRAPERSRAGKSDHRGPSGNRDQLRQEAQGENLPDGLGDRSKLGAVDAQPLQSDVVSGTSQVLQVCHLEDRKEAENLGTSVPIEPNEIPSGSQAYSWTGYESE